MAENKRFVAIDDSELYYITDTKNLKTLDVYIKEFSKPEYEFTEEEALSVAKEEYWQMIYENSMSAKENVDLLNNLIEENEQLKTRIQLLSPLLDLADIIIDVSADEKAKAFWEKKNEETEWEWEKILDGDVDD